MKDYHVDWYTQDQWEFKYILTVAKKPRFNDIEDISEHVDQVKEVKGEYEVVQETSTLIYENAVFVNSEDGRVRFTLRDDLMEENVSLDARHIKVKPEDVSEDSVQHSGGHYPYDEDVIPELEHREFNNSLDKIRAFFRETPVKELESEGRLRHLLPADGGSCLQEF